MAKSSPQESQSSGEQPKVKTNPVEKINLYTQTAQTIRKKNSDLLLQAKKFEQAGDVENLKKTTALLEQNQAKIGVLDKGIEAQKQQAQIDQPNTVANNLLIGGQQALGFLARSATSLDEAVNIIKKDMWASVGLAPSKEFEESYAKFLEESKGGLKQPSDYIAEAGKQIIKDANEKSEVKNIGLENGGSAWEALKEGKVKQAADYGFKGFIGSLPTSTLYLNPITATAVSGGMVGNQLDESMAEKGSVNSNDLAAGTIKAALEVVTERMFGAGKASRELIQSLGREGAEALVRQTAEDALKKTLIAKVGKNTAEEIGGEVVNQFGSNVVDKYLLDKKNVGVFDGVGDAAIIALFAGGGQGGLTTTLSHVIDKKQAAKYEENKAKADDLMQQALNAESPAVSTALEVHAEKLNTEANKIAEEQNQIGEFADKELVNEIKKRNAELVELEAAKQGLTDEEAISAIDTQIEATEKGLEVITKQAKEQALEEIKANEIVNEEKPNTADNGLSNDVVEPTLEEQNIEKKKKETEAKIKNKTLFLEDRDENGNRLVDENTKSGYSESVGEMISQSDVAPVPTSVTERNGIEFVEFSNPKTGAVDVIVTGTNDGGYVGYYRLYENGKPTNKWSSKFNNPSRNKENFKTMISGVQSMLPKGHEYTEKTSISTDGLRVWEQQLNRGYELQYDKNGKLITNEVAINGDAINNELGIDVNQGNFDNIRVNNNKDFDKVKKALIPYLEKFGLTVDNIRNINGTVVIDLPVLKSKTETNINQNQENKTEEPTNTKETPNKEETPIEKERARQIELLDTEKKITQLEKEIRKAPIRGSKGNPSQRQLRTQLNNYKEQLRELKGLKPKKKVTDSVLRITKRNFSNTVKEENLSLDERLIFSAIGSLSANDKDIVSSDANKQLRKQGALVKQGGLTIDQIVTDFINENDLDADMAQDFRNTLIDFVNGGDAYAWMNKIKEREAQLDPDAIRENEFFDDAYDVAVEYDLTDEEINELELEVIKQNELTQEEYEKLRNEFSNEGTEEGIVTTESKTDSSKEKDQARKSELEAKVKEAKNAYDALARKLAKAKQAAEKAGQEQQANIFGGKPADALLFGTDLRSLNNKVKEIQAEVDKAKENLDKAQLALDSFVPSNQVQLEVETPIQEQVVDNDSAELADLKEQLKKAKLTATKNEIQAKIDAEVKKVVVEKSINDVRDFLKDKFKINLPEGTQTKGFTLNQLIDLVADAAIELAKTGIDIELAIKQTIAALKEAKYIGDIDEAKLEASVKENLPKKEEKVKQEAEQGKRKLTKDFLEENPQYEDKVSEGAINYQVLPNQISLDMANAIIDKEGLGGAIDKFSDFEYPMNDTVRVILGQVLLARLQDNGQYDSVIKVLEQLTRTATNIAQQLQAFNVRSAISAETEYRIAQRIINKQRDLKAKTDKPTTDKIIKKAKEINKEIADEVVANLGDKINDNSKIKSQPNTNKADWGSKNKVFTKEAREKNKEALKKMFLSSVIPPQLIFEAGYHIEAGAVAFSDFYKSMTSEWGDKVVPYLKGAYQKASEDLITNGYDKEGFSKDAEIENVVWENDRQNKKLIKQVEVALKTKNRKAINKAIADLTNYAEKKGLWGQYRDYAIARLKAATAQSLSEDIKESVPLEDFTNGLVRNIQDQINEQIPEEDRKKNESKPKKPAIEIIADAFKNIEKYQEVFNKTRAEFTKKYSLEGLSEKEKEAKLEALEMTQEQAETYLEQLDAYFGDLTPKPFSGKLIGQAVKEKLKDLNISIADIVKQHYTVYDSAKRTLTDKLVQEAGLNEAEAAQLAKAVQNEFDRIAIEKKKQLLDKILSKKERKKSNVISLEEDIIRLTNLGAFSDQEILTAYAEKMGYPTLNQDNIKEIKRLANAVQLAKEGFDKSRAIENLLKYQANIKGVSKVDIAVSVWYANMLSGFSTQEVNFVANLLNSFLLYGNVVTQNPKFSKFVAQGYYEGFKRGWLEGKETFKTGYSPIRGKIEVPGLLERVDFKQFNVGKVDLNPANYLKYVGRVMKAADVVVFEALKDMRAYQLAAYEAGREGMLKPNQRQMDKAAEIVGASDFQFQAATEEAQLIYEQELEDISNNTELTKEQKETASNQAKTDRTRRVYELMERNRPDYIVEESSEFAARGTYNYKPEGFLGLMSSSMNSFKGSLSKAAEEADNKVVKYTAETLKVLTSIVIPFTNIIANVANESLNYTPLGTLRAKAGRSAIGFNGKTLTDQEQIDMYTKSLIGLTAMTTLFLLSQKFGDDDEPILEITANGHGDFRQNYSLQETGWQPYSIRIGKGPWLSYQYSPLFIVLGFIGQIRDYEKYRNEKLSDDGIKTKVAVAAGHTMTSILDMTFLSSAETLLSSAMDPRSEDKFGQLKKMLKSSAQSTVVPALYVQTAKEMERQFDIPLKEVSKTYMGAVLQHVPFARNMYYDKINGLGETIPPDTDKFISFSKDEKIWNLLKDKNISIVVPSQKQVKVVDDDLKQRFLTDEEYFNFVKKRGETLKGLIEKHYEKIVKMDKKKAQEYVSDLKTNATRKAKLAVNKNIKEE